MKQGDRIYTHVESIALDLNTHGVGQLTANEIAQALGLKRNFVSHHLNRLADEGRLIKSQTRPVCFIPTYLYEENPQLYMKPSAALALPTANGPSGPKGLASEAFSDIIGARGSLKEIVDQCKSTVLYPPHGLPILLYGPSGVGKSVFAQRIHTFAVSSGVLGQNAPFVVFNCAEYANNAELLSAALFGYVKGAFTGADHEKLGMLEAADGGILFLDEMHRLSPESQEKLFVFLDQGVFRRLGESSGWRRAQVRMVFATTAQPDDLLLETFLRRIPLIVKVPSYAERPLNEKLNLIRHLYHREVKQIGKAAHLSGQVVKMLVKTDLKGNIGNMQNAIKLSLASALSESIKRQDQGGIYVKVGHLPKSYHQALDRYLFDQDVYEDWLIGPNMAEPEVFEVEGLNSLQVFRSALARANPAEALPHMLLSVNELIDTVIFKNELSTNPILLIAIEKMVNYCLSDFNKKYGIQHYGNSAHVISRMVYAIHQWGEQAIEQGDVEICASLEVIMPKEFRLANKMVQLLCKHLDEQLPQILTLILTLYFRSLNRQVRQDQAHAVIIAHGYATASSIASVANRILGQYVYDAIDMPLDISAAEVNQQLARYVNQIGGIQGLIILVDMGSLETIYQGLGHRGLGDVAVVNNITTQLALDVGSRILDNEPIEFIVQQAVARNRQHYHFIKADAPKPNAILVTCSTGIGTAQKITHLLKGCFKPDAMSVIAYDFDRIRGNGKNEHVFQQYNIKLIIGTHDPLVPNMPYVSIEDLIMERDNGLISATLESVADTWEIEQMNREIVRAFTLENILNVLTILNPDKVSIQVDQALNRLEQHLGTILANSHRISLTIHLSCMIERLVMKTPISMRSYIEDFEVTHKRFIGYVKEAFMSIEQYYNIEIPISEVTYIYDNIKNRLNHFDL